MCWGWSRFGAASTVSFASWLCPSGCMQSRTRPSTSDHKQRVQSIPEKRVGLGSAWITVLICLCLLEGKRRVGTNVKVQHW